MATPTPPSRRERLRTSTLSEIKAHARRLLVDGGVGAVSLRAIGRDMGMSAPAIYRYFPSLEALVEALAADIFDELRESVVAAREGAGTDRVAQITAMARAFRAWSVAHPAEYTLVLGNPLPGIDAFEEGCVDESHPGARFGQPFMEVLAELWEETGYRTPPRSIMEERLAQTLDPLFVGHGAVKIEVAWAFLTGWTRLYGLVSMEVFQHMRWAVTEPRALFEMELSSFLHQLGLSGEGQATTRP